MICAAGRMVPAQAMLLAMTDPATRGSFISLNAAVQQFATGLAPMIAGRILIENSQKGLEGFHLVGLMSAVFGGVSMILAGTLESKTPR